MAVSAVAVVVSISTPFVVSKPSRSRLSFVFDSRSVVRSDGSIEFEIWIFQLQLPPLTAEFVS